MRLLPGAFREYSDNLKGHRRAWWRFQFVLHKSFFDMGFGLTSYLHLIGAAFAIVVKSMDVLAIYGITYFIACYIIGWAWFYFSFQEVQVEISNQVNVFVRQVRDSIGKNNWDNK